MKDKQQELTEAFARWRMDLPAVRTLVYRAPTPRERERWHALWLLARGWVVADVAAALERDPHTIGEWCAPFCRDGPTSITFEQTGGPPALNTVQQAELKGAVQASPRAAGIEAGDWNWKVVRTFCRERFGVTLCRSSCLNYLYLRLVRLSAYSPDFNADDHIWGGIQEEVTANTCFGTATQARAHVDPFLKGLAARTEEVKQRCRSTAPR